MNVRAMLVSALVVLSFATAAIAVQPSEVLDDPALEARARELSAGLRCMVCQNQSIDDSDAELARDLRVLVRERLLAGETDEQVIDYVVSRYGEFVLLQPTFSARNAALWATPVVLLALGAGFLAINARHRRRKPVAALTPEEERQLSQLVDRDD